MTGEIQKELWSKLLFISPIAAVSSIVRLPVGEYRNVDVTRDLIVSAMQEVKSLAEASGVKLDNDVIDQKLKFIDGLEPGSFTSTQRNVTAGQKSEIEELVGMLLRMGKGLDVSMPTYKFLYSVLEPVELRARELPSKSDNS